MLRFPPLRLAPGFFWPVLVALALLVTIWGLCWGAPIPILDVFSPDTNKSEVARQIFLHLRPTRVVAALLVGASLSVGGGALQTVFRNPLAEPYLLGISAGGALGATLALAFNLPTFGVFDTSSVLAFGGSLLAATAVYGLGRTPQGVNSRFSTSPDRARLLLVGVALSAFLASLMSFVVTISGRADLAQQISFWLLGGFTRASWPQNGALAISLGIGLLLLLRCSRDLNALRAGEEEAATLGVEVGILHRRVLIAASLLAATSVAAAGLIGFIGLLAPHIVRLLGGREIKTLLVASAIFGGTLLCACDTLAHTIRSPIEIPVGIITSLLGVPLFLSLARRV